MGIIGVVAALILPNLNSSTGEKEKVVKLQKIYSNLEDAFGRVTATYGAPNRWLLVSGSDNKNQAASKRLAERMADFLKVTKACTGYSVECFDNPNGDDYPPYYQFALADGSSINVYASGSESSYASGSADVDAPERHVYGFILVDIDGVDKGENQAGYDIFQFYVTANGIIPAGGPNDNYKFNPTTVPSSTAAYNTTAWVLKSGNMDYLKNKNGKCPDGSTVLSWTQLSCK